MDAPHISEIIQNYVTAVAILLGGGWALWRWGFEEWRRSKREIPSLDGTLSALTTDLDEDRALVSLYATWPNRGVLPVKIDIKKTSVSIYELTDSLELGPLSASEADALVPIYESHPLSVYEDYYVLEPGTDSVLQEHFVFDKAKTYLIRWENWLHSAEYTWGRDLVWQYPKGETIQAQQKAAENHSTSRPKR